MPEFKDFSEQEFQAYLEQLGTSARIDQVTGAAIYRSINKSTRGVHDNEPHVDFNPGALLKDKESNIIRLAGNLEDTLNDLNSLVRNVNKGEKTAAINLFQRSSTKIEGYVRDGVFLIIQMAAENAAIKAKNLRRPIFIDEKPVDNLKTLLIKVLLTIKALYELDNDQEIGIDESFYEPFLKLFSGYFRADDKNK